MHWLKNISTSFYSSMVWLIKHSLVFHVLIFKGFYNFLYRFWELTRSKIGFKNKQRKSGRNHLQQCPREYYVIIRIPAIQQGKNMRMTRELCQKRRKIKARLRHLLCYSISRHITRSMIQQKQKKLKEKQCTIVGTWLSCASYEHESGASRAPHVSLVENCSRIITIYEEYTTIIM